MFANRFTAFIDACSLAGVLKRNLLLSLAEAEFYRLRWSPEVLAETRVAIERMGLQRGLPDAQVRSERAIAAMTRAFSEAMVTEYSSFLSATQNLPDPNDAHVVAAALKTQAAVIVTENLKHFPEDRLVPLGLEVRSADIFIADTIALDPGKAVAAIRRMRARFRNPAKSPEALLRDMEAGGLTAVVDVLKSHVESL